MMIRDKNQSLPEGLSPIEAAAHWHARTVSDDPQDVDARAFAAWVGEKPANAHAVERVQESWDIFENADDDVHVKALRQTALADAPLQSNTGWYGRIAGVAAVFVMALVVTLILFEQPSQIPVPQAENVPLAGTTGIAPEYSTATGELKNVVLPDGTEVTLNTDTRISLEYSADQRVVRLAGGQAFFQVAKNPNRPFIVNAADRRITALGTAFEVRLDPSRIEVVLTEGRVSIVHSPEEADSVGAAASQVTLTPGQALVAVLGKPQRIVTPNVEEKLRWRDGFVEFRDTPLSAAVAEMNRYSTRRLRVSDGQVADLRVSGLFRTKDANGFVDIVSELLPVEAQTRTDGTVEFVKADKD